MFSTATTRGSFTATNQGMTPQIQMIVGDWYTDEFGNQARIIKAGD
jgi:hypothetical protein